MEHLLYIVNMKGSNSIVLHKSLNDNQAHLLTDDRYGKYENFLNLALEKGVVKKEGNYLIRNRSNFPHLSVFIKGESITPSKLWRMRLNRCVNFDQQLRPCAGNRKSC